MQPFLKPVDRLSIVFLILLAAVALFGASGDELWSRFLIKYLPAALAVAAIAALDRGGRTNTLTSVLHLFMPVAVVLVVFNSLGDLIPLIRHRLYDGILVRIDYAIFGVHPTIWCERFINPVLTGVLQIAYISYYFMPISLGVILFVRGRERPLDEAVFGIVLCFFLSYIGYILVPALGPRYALAHLQTSGLRAGTLTLWIQQTLNGLEHNKTDAFPSGHTAVALMTLYYAWKSRERTLFRVLVPACAALIVSTVYLRYHYVIDVIAGIVLTGLTIAVAPAFFRLFSRSSCQPEE